MNKPVFWEVEYICCHYRASNCQASALQTFAAQPKSFLVPHFFQLPSKKYLVFSVGRAQMHLIDKCKIV